MYYVYVYLNPLKPGKFIYCNLEYSYEPFYVGKGKNRRKYSHLNSSKDDGNRLKTNTINKILKSGQIPIIEMILESSSEEESYKKEIEVISIIGRRDLSEGPLSNMSFGGEGCSRIQTIEEKNKRSKSQKDKISNGIRWGFLKIGYQDIQKKIVLQFDLDGNLIKKWNSIIEIKDSMSHLQKPHISACCRGLRKTHGGFIWKYESLSDINEYQNKKLKNNKPNGNISRDKKMADSFGLDLETFIKYRIEKGPHFKWSKFLETKKVVQ